MKWIHPVIGIMLILTVIPAVFAYTYTLQKGGDDAMVIADVTINSTHSEELILNSYKLYCMNNAPLINITKVETVYEGEDSIPRDIITYEYSRECNKKDYQTYLDQQVSDRMSGWKPRKDIVGYTGTCPQDYNLVIEQGLITGCVPSR